MDPLSVFLALILFAAIMAFVVGRQSAADNREPYLRDRNGNALALLCVGPNGDVPNHEGIVHDGTPHQNPAITTQTEYSTKAMMIGALFGTVIGGLLASLPGAGMGLVCGIMAGLMLGLENYEYRYYPLTVSDDGRIPNVDAITRAIARRRMGPGQRMEITAMPAWAERQAVRRENGQQLTRGVGWGAMPYDRNGRPKKSLGQKLWSFIQWLFFIAVLGVVAFFMLAIAATAGQW